MLPYPNTYKYKLPSVTPWVLFKWKNRLSCPCSVPHSPTRSIQILFAAECHIFFFLAFVRSPQCYVLHSPTRSMAKSCWTLRKPRGLKKFAQAAKCHCPTTIFLFFIKKIVFFRHMNVSICVSRPQLFSILIQAVYTERSCEFVNAVSVAANCPVPSLKLRPHWLIKFNIPVYRKPCFLHVFGPKMWPTNNTDWQVWLCACPYQVLQTPKNRQ